MRPSEQQQRQGQVRMRGTSRSHSSTGARATWGRSMAQCSSVRLRCSATAWLSTSGTPTSVGRLPRCRARRPSRSAFRTRRSTVGCPRRVAWPHLPRPSGRRRRLTGVRLAGVEPYRYGMSQGADLVYVWFVAASAAMNGLSATVGMVHADGSARRGSTRASNRRVIAQPSLLRGEGPRPQRDHQGLLDALQLDGIARRLAQRRSHSYDLYRRSPESAQSASLAGVTAEAASSPAAAQ